MLTHTMNESTGGTSHSADHSHLVCLRSLAASLRAAASQAAAHHARLLRGEGLLADLHPEGEKTLGPSPSAGGAVSNLLSAPQELYDHMNSSLGGSALDGSQVFLGACCS